MDSLPTESPPYLILISCSDSKQCEEVLSLFMQCNSYIHILIFSLFSFKKNVFEGYFNNSSSQKINFHWEWPSCMKLSLERAPAFSQKLSEQVNKISIIYDFPSSILFFSTAFFFWKFFPFFSKDFSMQIWMIKNKLGDS